MPYFNHKYEIGEYDVSLILDNFGIGKNDTKRVFYSKVVKKISFYQTLAIAIYNQQAESGVYIFIIERIAKKDT